MASLPQTRTWLNSYNAHYQIAKLVADRNPFMTKFKPTVSRMILQLAQAQDVLCGDASKCCWSGEVPARIGSPDLLLREELGAM